MHALPPPPPYAAAARQLTAAAAPAAASCPTLLKACTAANSDLTKKLTSAGTNNRNYLILLARAKGAGTACTKQLGSCNTAKTALASQVTKLSATLATGGAAVATTATDDCQAALAEKDAQIAALTQQLAASSATISQLQQQLAAAQQRATDAEAALDAALADGAAKAEQADATITTLQEQAETATAAQQACEQQVVQLASVERRLAATTTALNVTEDSLAQTRIQLATCDEQHEAAALANGARCGCLGLEAGLGGAGACLHPSALRSHPPLPPPCFVPQPSATRPPRSSRPMPRRLLMSWQAARPTRAHAGRSPATCRCVGACGAACSAGRPARGQTPNRRTRPTRPPPPPFTPARALQDALTVCTAAKSAANSAYVSCQNRAIDLQQTAETSSQAAGEARALLGDCEARLQDALAQLTPKP